MKIHILYLHCITLLSLVSAFIAFHFLVDLKFSNYKNVHFILFSLCLSFVRIRFELQRCLVAWTCEPSKYIFRWQLFDWLTRGPTCLINVIQMLATDIYYLSSNCLEYCSYCLNGCNRVLFCIASDSNSLIQRPYKYKYTFNICIKCCGVGIFPQKYVYFNLKSGNYYFLIQNYFSTKILVGLYFYTQKKTQLPMHSEKSPVFLELEPSYQEVNGTERWLAKYRNIEQGMWQFCPIESKFSFIIHILKYNLTIITTRLLMLAWWIRRYFHICALYSLLYYIIVVLHASIEFSINAMTKLWDQRPYIKKWDHTWLMCSELYFNWLDCANKTDIIFCFNAFF